MNEQLFLESSLCVTTERVDDIPVLVSEQVRLSVPALLDEHFEPHGNWQGTSLGWTTSIWLTHILSEGDHRLSWSQEWVEDHLETLEGVTGQPIRGLEWSDDRLGIVLDLLSDDTRWQGFERSLNQQTVRVYRLEPSVVRLDSTTASGYWTVTEEGLFQFGHSKDHRPDLPQVKVMLSVLDPLGMPLASQVVAGQRADDPLYLPAIEEVRASLGQQGLLYVGDSKMAALGTRGSIDAARDYYLCPLPQKQMPEEVLESYLEPVWAGQQPLTLISREDATGECREIAVGYERSLLQSHEGEGNTHTWHERHLVVCSLQHAQASEKALHTRLTKAQAELESLNQRKRGKRRFPTREAMVQAAEAILKRHRVMDLLQVTVQEHMTQRQVRSYAGKPARVETQHQWQLFVAVDQEALVQRIRRLGWRVYATNHPQQTLPLDKAVLAYREEFLVERSLGRLKGKPLSLTPMFLESDQRATALVRLLTIGLRVLTLLEFQARQALAQANQTIQGLYAGNPKRATPRPTAEALLRAFKNITLTCLSSGQQAYRHITPLSQLQADILALWDFPKYIYTQLASQLPQPP